MPVLDAYSPLVVPVYAVYPERSRLHAAVTAFIDFASEWARSQIGPPSA